MLNGLTTQSALRRGISEASVVCNGQKTDSSLAYRRNEGQAVNPLTALP
jgi:hypothetical protein